MVRELTRFDPGIDQLVVRLFAPGELDSHLEAAGIPVEPLGFDSSRAGYNWGPAARSFARVVARFEPDVVQSSLFSANLVAQLATRSSRVPVLSTFTLSGDRDLLRAHQPGASSIKGDLLRGLGGYAARADHVWFRALTHDAAITNCRLLRVDQARAVVIPRGVIAEDLAGESRSRAELGLPQEIPLVLNVGRQAAQKGQAHLLRSFAEILSSTEAHLVVVGREGDASAEVRQLIADLDLAKHVTLVGYTPHVHHYFAHATVFAFASLMEGLGTAVLEAMAAGVPVVAFDIPPVREVADDGRLARLVALGDEADFATALLEVLSGDPGPREMAAAALETIHSEYSVDVVASRVEERLRQVAEDG